MVKVAHNPHSSTVYLNSTQCAPRPYGGSNTAPDAHCILSTPRSVSNKSPVGICQYTFQTRPVEWGRFGALRIDTCAPGPTDQTNTRRISTSSAPRPTQDNTTDYIINTKSKPITMTPGQGNRTAMTPPSSPTKPMHSKSSSTSSALSTSSADLYRMDSVTVLETPTIEFPFWATDYDYTTKKKLGEGAWSDVYRVQPCLPQSSSLKPGASTEATPPITPLNQSTKANGNDLPQIPEAYALKVPASRSAKAVLTAEARVLSHLSRFQDASRHVIPFYGLDMRTNALVLQAMDTSLESWVKDQLNALPEPARTEKLAAVFPYLATNLLHSLTWMHTHGCTHADIKPGNVLLNISQPTLQAVYTDFSAAILSHNSDSKPPIGGGTWDFLAPELVTSKPDAPGPTASSDLWALSMTLLFVIIGASPFDCMPNAFLKRDTIKRGEPLKYVAVGEKGPTNVSRMKNLSIALGFDVLAWLGAVLVVDPENRVSADEWIGGIDGLVKKGAKI